MPGKGLKSHSGFQVLSSLFSDLPAWLQRHQLIIIDSETQILATCVYIRVLCWICSVFVFWRKWNNPFILTSFAKCMLSSLETPLSGPFQPVRTFPTSMTYGGPSLDDKKSCYLLRDIWNEGMRTHLKGLKRSGKCFLTSRVHFKASSFSSQLTDPQFNSQARLSSGRVRQNYHKCRDELFQKVSQPGNNSSWWSNQLWRVRGTEDRLLHFQRRACLWGSAPLQAKGVFV